MVELKYYFFLFPSIKGMILVITQSRLSYYFIPTFCSSGLQRTNVVRRIVLEVLWGVLIFSHYFLLVGLKFTNFMRDVEHEWNDDDPHDDDCHVSKSAAGPLR